MGEKNKNTERHNNVKNQVTLNSIFGPSKEHYLISGSDGFDIVFLSVLVSPLCGREPRCEC
jgi:hypothetical protein